MPYTRPEIVSGTTKLDKPFFENTFDGIDEKISREEANSTYAPLGSTGGVGITKDSETGMYAISSSSTLTKDAVTGMYPIGA